MKRKEKPGKTEREKLLDDLCQPAGFGENYLITYSFVCEIGGHGDPLLLLPVSKAHDKKKEHTADKNVFTMRTDTIDVLAIAKFDLNKYQISKLKQQMLKDK